jgi:hypothetical protein
VKTGRLINALIVAAALLYGASAGASSHRSPHDEDSSADRKKTMHHDGKDKNDLRRHAEKKPEGAKHSTDNAKAFHAPGSINFAAEAKALWQGSKAVISRVYAVRPAGIIAFSKTSRGVWGNRGPHDPAILGGPASSMRNTGAINGTEMKRRH